MLSTGKVPILREMLYPPQIIHAFWDLYKLLHLAREHTALNNSGVRTEIGSKMLKLFPSLPFIIGIFSEN